MRSILLGLAVLLLSVASPAVALAASSSWTGGAGDQDWTKADNWSDGVPEGYGAIIPMDMPNYPIITQGIAVGPSTLDIEKGASVTIVDGGELVVGGVTTVFESGLLDCIGGIYTTEDITVAGNANFTGGTMTVNGTLDVNGGTATITSDMTVGALLITSGVVDVQTATLPGGSWDLDQVGATVSYSGGLNQTVASAQYYDLIVAKTGNTATLSANTVVLGSVSLSGGTLAVGASNYSLTVGGGWGHTLGTFSAGSGTVTFNGSTTPVSILGAGNTAFNNVTINKSAQSNVVKIQNSCTVGGTLLLSVGTLQVESATMPGTTKDVDQSGTTVTYAGTLAQTVASTTYANFTVNKSSNTATLGGAIVVNGNLTLTLGTLATANNGVSLLGNWTHSGGTFTAGSGTVTFSGATTPVSISGAVNTTFNSVTINKTNQTDVVKILNDSTIALSASSTLLLTKGTLQVEVAAVPGTVKDLDQSGTTVVFAGALASQTVPRINYHHLTINKSAGSAVNASSVNVLGNLTITSGTYNANGGNVTVEGNWVHNGGTFTHGNNTVIMSGTADASISGAVDTAFYNLTVNKTNPVVVVDPGDDEIPVDAFAVSEPEIEMAAVLCFELAFPAKVTIANSATVSNILTLTSGQLEIQSATMPGTTKDVDQSGTNVIYSGTLAQTVAATPYDSLQINKASGAASLAAATTVANMLAITSGTLDVTVSNYQLSVGGNWKHTAGTFTARSGTVVLNGTAASCCVYGGGGTVFNNLTINKSTNKKIVQLDMTVTINGTFLLTMGFLNINVASVPGAVLDFDQATTTVAFVTSAAQSVPVTTYANLDIDKGSSSRAAFNGGTLVVNESLTLTRGVFAIGGNSDILDVNGNVVFANNATVNLDAAGAMTVGGSWTRNGGTYTTGGTLTFDGATTPVAIGGTATTAFGNLTINKTLASNIVQWNNASTIATGGSLTVTQGVLQVGATTLASSESVNVAAAGTLSLSSTSAIVNIAATKTLTINGTLKTTTALSPKGTIQGNGGACIVTIGATATLDVDGMKFNTLSAAGLIIANGATFTKFKNVQFLNNAGGAGSKHLNITANNLNLTIEGGNFDNTAASNVHLAGNGTGDGETVVNMDYVDAATNGAGAGESLDSDDDNAPVDGIGDTPATNGAVVTWAVAKSLYSSVSGAKVIGIFEAIDWLTFASKNYKYVFINNIDAGGSEGVLVVNAAGTVLYSYSFTSAIEGVDPGDMLPGNYNTLNEQTVGSDLDGDGSITNTAVQLIYVPTSTGKLHILIDTGAALDKPGVDSVWNSRFESANVSTITSSVIVDATNVYFGGTQAAASPANRIFGVRLSDKTLQMNLAGTDAEIATYPAWFRAGGVNYLYIASKKDVGLGYASMFRVDGTNGAIDKTNNTATFDVLGPINYDFFMMHCGDTDGNLHGVLHQSENFTNATGWPFNTGNGDAIRGGIASHYFLGTSYFGDDGGQVYCVDKDGVLAGGWPVAPAGLGVVDNSPVFDISNDRLYVSGQNGRVAQINASTGAVNFIYDYGAGVQISRVGLDFNTGKPLFGLATYGQVVFATP